MFILMISEYACISFFKDYHQSANKFLNFWKRVSISYLLKNTGLKLFLNGMPQSFLPLRGSSVVKNLPANAGDLGSNPGSGRSLQKEMQSTPIFLPEKPHGQRKLVG